MGYDDIFLDDLDMAQEENDLIIIIIIMFV